MTSSIRIPPQTSYAVKRLPDGQFIVSHYPTVDAAKPCCRPVHVRTRAGEDEVQTLARADQMIQQQHAEQRKRAIA